MVIRRKPRKPRGYFDRAGVRDRIDVRVGDALEILSEEKREFDIIFAISIKKTTRAPGDWLFTRAQRRSIRCRQRAVERTRGVCSRESVKPSAEGSTKALVEFNKAMYESPDFFTTILPIRDRVDGKEVSSDQRSALSIQSHLLQVWQ